MSSGSIHDKLTRVRKPRVHITYEVETEGAKVVKDLPFVVGVLGDFVGKPTSPLKPMKDRKFVMIDRDNFNDVMARMAPALQFRVANTLKGDGSEMAVNLKFNSLEDFDPGRVVQQIEPLKKMLETRDKLRDLLTKVDRSDDLENLLESILKNDESIKKLSTELGAGGTGDTNAGEPKS